MINNIWLVLVVTGIIFSAMCGNTDKIFSSFTTGAASAVELCIGLVSFMAIWCGILRLAEKSGLLKTFTKLLYPLLHILFPDLKKDHKALGPIAMNITANLFGLGNAATPFGIKAMKELAETSSSKGIANKEMIIFLVLNTSAVSIMPGIVMGLRTEAGSLNSAEIILPAFLSSLCGLLASLLLVFILEKFWTEK